MNRRIFVVEDHPAMRESICELIEIQPDLTVCGSAGSAEDALLALEACAEDPVADLILTDMALPGMSGTELVSALRQRWPDLTCAVLSGYQESSDVARALAAGAEGYILKGLPYELGPALGKILAGERYLSPPLR